MIIMRDSVSYIKQQNNWTMIAAYNLWSDHVVDQVWKERFGKHKVVESPADVFLAWVAHIAPVSVLIDERRIEVSKRVNISIGEQSSEAVALLLREASTLAIRLGILQIDLVVRHVQVAAPDYRLLLVQFVQVVAKRFLPFHSVAEADQSTATIRIICMKILNRSLK